MVSYNFELPFESEEVLESFLPENTLLAELDDQGLREQQIDERITDLELRDKTHEGLDQERQLTVGKFRELPPNPYDEQLGAADVKLDREIEEANLALTEARKRMSDEQRSYDDQLQWSIRLAPLSEQAAKELVERKKNEVELRETSEARERLERLEAARAVVDSLFEAGIRAWPVLIEQKSNEADFDDTDFEFEDKIPIDPMPRGEGTHERCVRQRLLDIDKELPYKFIEFMSNNLGKILDVEKIALKVVRPDDLVILREYDEENDTHYLRSKITSGLGPEGHGQQIQAQLNELGLLLQYGWRTMVKKDRLIGEELSRSRPQRIYRVLTIGDHAAENMDEATTDSSNGSIHENHDKWEAVPVVESPRLIPVTPEPAPINSGHTNNQPGNGSISAGQAGLTHSPVSRDTPESPEVKDTGWQQTFSGDVRAAIKRLDAQGAMRPGVFFVQDVQVNKALSSLCVYKNIEDFSHQTGLMHRPPRSKRQLRKMPMTTFQLVGLSLFRTHRIILSSRNSRKVAEEIIKGEISDYFRRVQEGEELALA